ncbi:MAG: hypothetical protein A3J83_02350 [Elusimicrobia bacterium RIFOXYA2_FULL_40_6]|nr:MAG: hypothetical protein A3J83_02350 [Elusimicrobia bacterium RIFOXYA2_FULL_40_6]
MTKKYKSKMPSVFIRKLYDKGLTLLKTAHREKAKIFFNRIIDKDPSRSHAYSFLGEIYYQLHQESLAEKNFKKALEINRNNFDAYFFFSLLLHYQKKLPAAIRLFKKLTKTKSYSASAYYLLGYTGVITKDYTKAIVYLNKSLIENTGNLKSYFLLMFCYRKQKKYDEAVKVLVKALKIDPTYYLLHAEYKMLQSEMKYLKPDISVPKMVSRECDELSINAAIEYINCNLFQEAIIVLSDAENNPDFKNNPLLYYCLGYVYYEAGLKDKAVKYFKTASGITKSYFMPNRLEIAEVLWLALKLNPGDGMCNYHLGNIMFAADRFDEAISYWQKAVFLLKDTNPTLLRNLGMAYRTVKSDLIESVRYYKKAINIDPLDCHLYHELDEIYAELGMQNERVCLLKNAPEKVVKHPVILKRWAYLLCDLEQFEKGIKLLEEKQFTFSEGGYDVINLYKFMSLQQGKKLRSSGKYKQAVKYFRKSIWYPSTLGIELKFVHNLQGLYELGKTCNTLGDRAKAKKYWKKIIESVSISGTHLRYYQALAYRQLGKNNEAEKIFDELLAINKKRLENIGHEEPLTGGEKSMLSLSSHEKEAISYLYYVRGLGYLGKNKIDSAMEEFRKSVNKYHQLRWAQVAMDELNP